MKRRSNGGQVLLSPLTLQGSRFTIRQGRRLTGPFLSEKIMKIVQCGAVANRRRQLDSELAFQEGEDMEAVSKFSVADRVRPWTTSLAWAGAFAVLLIGAPALAQVSVPGSSNPYLSGMPGGSACCGGDVAPAQSPVQVTGVTVSPGSSLTFSATGSVNFVPGPSGDPPDGGGVLAATPANNGISGASWPANALVAVFLDNALPTITSAPASLDFSTPGSRSFSSLSPALKQAFFVGDGLTGNGTGAVQTFVVPPGATRLFLGTSDGSGWFNNSGAFSVTVAAVSAPPPVGSAAAIPTLSDAMIVVLALLLAGAATVLIPRA